MKSVLFRVDGSERVGMGHVMRCMAIARQLISEGVAPVFVMKDLSSSALSYVRTNGVSVRTIPAGVGFEKDAELTAEEAVQRRISIIITDISCAEALARRKDLDAFHRYLKSAGFFVVCLAGGEVIDPSSDVVVSPYCQSWQTSICHAASGKILLGPQYFIFRDEFRRAADVLRSINDQVQRILVTIGGSDPLNLSLSVAEALGGIQKTPALSVRFVIGPGFTPVAASELAQRPRSFQGSWEVLRDPDNMADLMLWSDLAITGDGLTKYETAVTGTPSIMLSRWDSEAELNRAFVSAGSTIHLDVHRALDAAASGETIRRVMEDPSLRASMSVNGKRLVDGRGLDRVMSYIPVGVAA